MKIEVKMKDVKPGEKFVHCGVVCQKLEIDAYYKNKHNLDNNYYLHCVQLYNMRLIGKDVNVLVEVDREVTLEDLPIGTMFSFPALLNRYIKGVETTKYNQKTYTLWHVDSNTEGWDYACTPVGKIYNDKDTEENN